MIRPDNNEDRRYHAIEEKLKVDMSREWRRRLMPLNVASAAVLLNVAVTIDRGLQRRNDAAAHHFGVRRSCARSGWPHARD